MTGRGPRPHKDRRAAAGKPGSLRRLKAALFRPMGVQVRDGRLHLGLVERRHAQADEPPSIVPPWWDEVREYLVVQEDEQLERVARHLNAVVDELGRSGWRGVKVLPSAVLAKAEAQALLVDSEDAPPAMERLIEGLRLATAAARQRDLQAPRLPTAAGDLEVSETSAEEFDAVRRDVIDRESKPPKADRD